MVVLTVVAATKRDLARLPKDLRESSLAASALALAKELDSNSSATSKSMCAKTHLEIMDRLRELAPAVEETDVVSDLGAYREKRRKGMPNPTY